MPGLIGLTCRGTTPVDCRAVAGRMLALLTHPEYDVADPVWSDDAVCGALSHTGLGRRTAGPVQARGLVVWLDGELCEPACPAPGLGVGEGSGGRSPIDALREDDVGDGLRADDGAFAAAVYDPAARTVSLIGDRLGLRPLYRTVRDGHLLWASDLGAFLGYLRFSPVIDVRGVREFLDVGHLLGDRSLFEGVRLLDPATVLTFDLDRCEHRLERYWGLERIRPAGRVSHDDAVDEPVRRFRRAVAARASSSERVRLSLSGGLDSRAVLALVPKRSRPLPSITFGRPGSSTPPSPRGSPP